MQFHKLSLEQIQQAREMYPYITSRTCDYTVGGMFMWRNYYHMEYAFEQDAFYTRLTDDGSRYCYSLPVAQDIKTAIRYIIEKEIPQADVKIPLFGQIPSLEESLEEGRSLEESGESLEQQGAYLCFSTVPFDCLPYFIELADELPIRLVTNLQTDYFDYLYRAEDLVNLAGRKYSGQRNQIKQFEKNYPDWHFEELTKERLDDVRTFFGINTEITEEHNTRNEENLMVQDVLDHMDIYQMIGGILYVGDQVVGFSMGEIKGDTIFQHIEKANRDFKGCNQMLTNQFAKYFVTDDIRYINREEDMGNPGLRRAKEAWQPVDLLKKYVVEVIPYAN